MFFLQCVNSKRFKMISIFLEIVNQLPPYEDKNLNLIFEVIPKTEFYENFKTVLFFYAFYLIRLPAD